MSQKAETVLVVDDDDAVNSTIKIVLQRNGYQVLVAKSAQEAINLLEEKNAAIQLLLTDITLPGDVSGPQLAEKLQAKCPSLKVIFSTGHDVSSLQTELGLGSNATLLQKPFELSSLLQMVRKVLGEK